MKITGKQIIGYSIVDGGADSFESTVASDERSGPYIFEEGSAENVDQAAKKASAAFKSYKLLPVADRVKFLETIASEINNIRDTLVSVAMQETHLPQPRLNGEIDRTINQINSFVSLLKEGSWVNAIIDTAKPERQPLPKPAISQMLRPLGVVGVFGASNFPFAFSVAGGDTISALAAGCPVVYKAHFGHPVTSELTGNCIIEAARKTGMPDGVFSLIQGRSTESGKALVTHPLVKAIGFTGSLAGGRALFDLAVKREEPIPVYAEMGSVNPVFLLPGKLKEDVVGIAKSLVASNTLGVGQFCTNPGVVLMIKGAESEQFLTQYTSSLTAAAGGSMLTESIYNAYVKGIAELESSHVLKSVGNGVSGNANTATPHAFKVSGTDFLKDRSLFEEHFGPVALHVIADDIAQLSEIAEHIPGQLTTSIWADQSDFAEFKGLFDILEEKAGRLMINNVPTGVEVTYAMQHGGPYPATTDSRSTSVGSQAIYRFMRPVAYQNFPQELLPAELQNTNPLNIWRKVDGELTKIKID
ncbi:aldehyde dehydrogenase (NADP(+)) [Mucilaginibacter corticis]|uniref:Aldehyde dehydrogenase (NADP(+)) n=1 Tax=Mucilaginibacter corticis TaxID=2597670 RepID=A0A556MBP8_9SPHI|nr:aldehyde dehydrogenase (NADP(+)) [Mucilaginibacter corticis]TSJ37357.1 aldehyde dehydrogenase (NADP(+)) [Mucilaginibacter corticis]